MKKLRTLDLSAAVVEFQTDFEKVAATFSDSEGRRSRFERIKSSPAPLAERRFNQRIYLIGISDRCSKRRIANP